MLDLGEDLIWAITCLVFVVVFGGMTVRVVAPPGFNEHRLGSLEAAVVATDLWLEHQRTSQ